MSRLTDLTCNESMPSSEEKQQEARNAANRSAAGTPAAAAAAGAGLFGGLPASPSTPNRFQRPPQQQAASRALYPSNLLSMTGLPAGLGQGLGGLAGSLATSMAPSQRLAPPNPLPNALQANEALMRVREVELRRAEAKKRLEEEEAVRKQYEEAVKAQTASVAATASPRPASASGAPNPLPPGVIRPTPTMPTYTSPLLHHQNALHALGRPATAHAAGLMGHDYLGSSPMQVKQIPKGGGMVHAPYTPTIKNRMTTFEAQQLQQAAQLQQHLQQQGLRNMPNNLAAQYALSQAAQAHSEAQRHAKLLQERREAEARAHAQSNHNDKIEREREEERRRAIELNKQRALQAQLAEQARYGRNLPPPNQQGRFGTSMSLSETQAISNSTALAAAAAAIAREREEQERFERERDRLERAAAEPMTMPVIQQPAMHIPSILGSNRNNFFTNRALAQSPMRQSPINAPNSSMATHNLTEQLNLLNSSPMGRVHASLYGSLASSLTGVGPHVSPAPSTPQVMATPSPRPSILRRKGPDNSAAKRRLGFEDGVQTVGQFAASQLASGAIGINDVKRPKMDIEEIKKEINDAQLAASSLPSTSAAAVPPSAEPTPKKRQRKQQFDANQAPEQIRMQITEPPLVPILGVTADCPGGIIYYQLPAEAPKKKRGRPSHLAKEQALLEAQSTTRSIIVDVDTPRPQPEKKKQQRKPKEKPPIYPMPVAQIKEEPLDIPQTPPRPASTARPKSAILQQHLLHQQQLQQAELERQAQIAAMIQKKEIKKEPGVGRKTPKPRKPRGPTKAALAAQAAAAAAAQAAAAAAAAPQVAVAHPPLFEFPEGFDPERDEIVSSEAKAAAREVAIQLGFIGPDGKRRETPAQKRRRLQEKREREKIEREMRERANSDAQKQLKIEMREKELLAEEKKEERKKQKKEKKEEMKRMLEAKDKKIRFLSHDKDIVRRFINELSSDEEEVEEEEKEKVGENKEEVEKKEEEIKDQTAATADTADQTGTVKEEEKEEETVRVTVSERELARLIGKGEDFRIIEEKRTEDEKETDEKVSLRCRDQFVETRKFVVTPKFEMPMKSEKELQRLSKTEEFGEAFRLMNVWRRGQCLTEDGGIIVEEKMNVARDLLDARKRDIMIEKTFNSMKKKVEMERMRKTLKRELLEKKKNEKEKKKEEEEEKKRQEKGDDKTEEVKEGEKEEEKEVEKKEKSEEEKWRDVWIEKMKSRREKRMKMKEEEKKKKKEEDEKEAAEAEKNKLSDSQILSLAIKEVDEKLRKRERTPDEEVAFYFAPPESRNVNDSDLIKTVLAKQKLKDEKEELVKQWKKIVASFPKGGLIEYEEEVTDEEETEEVKKEGEEGEKKKKKTVTKTRTIDCTVSEKIVRVSATNRSVEGVEDFTPFTPTLHKTRVITLGEVELAECEDGRLVALRTIKDRFLARQEKINQEREKLQEEVDQTIERQSKYIGHDSVARAVEEFRMSEAMDAVLMRDAPKLGMIDPNLITMEQQVIGFLSNNEKINKRDALLEKQMADYEERMREREFTSSPIMFYKRIPDKKSILGSYSVNYDAREKIVAEDGGISDFVRMENDALLREQYGRMDDERRARFERYAENVISSFSVRQELDCPTKEWQDGMKERIVERMVEQSKARLLETYDQFFDRHGREKVDKKRTSRHKLSKSAKKYRRRVNALRSVAYMQKHGIEMPSTEANSSRPKLSDELKQRLNEFLNGKSKKENGLTGQELVRRYKEIEKEAIEKEKKREEKKAAGDEPETSQKKDEIKNGTDIKNGPRLSKKNAEKEKGKNIQIVYKKKKNGKIVKVRRTKRKLSEEEKEILEERERHPVSIVTFPENHFLAKDAAEERNKLIEKAREEKKFQSIKKRIEKAEVTEGEKRKILDELKERERKKEEYKQWLIKRKEETMRKKKAAQEAEMKIYEAQAANAKNGKGILEKEELEKIIDIPMNEEKKSVNIWIGRKKEEKVKRKKLDKNGKPKKRVRIMIGKKVYGERKKKRGTRRRRNTELKKKGKKVAFQKARRIRTKKPFTPSSRDVRSFPWNDEDDSIIIPNELEEKAIEMRKNLRRRIREKKMKIQRTRCPRYRMKEREERKRPSFRSLFNSEDLLSDTEDDLKVFRAIVRTTLDDNSISDSQFSIFLKKVERAKAGFLSAIDQRRIEPPTAFKDLVRFAINHGEKYNERMETAETVDDFEYTLEDAELSKTERKAYLNRVKVTRKKFNSLCGINIKGDDWTVQDELREMRKASGLMTFPKLPLRMGNKQLLQEMFLINEFNGIYVKRSEKVMDQIVELEEEDEERKKRRKEKEKEKEKVEKEKDEKQLKVEVEEKKFTRVPSIRIVGETEEERKELEEKINPSISTKGVLRAALSAFDSAQDDEDYSDGESSGNESDVTIGRRRRERSWTYETVREKSPSFVDYGHAHWIGQQVHPSGLSISPRSPAEQPPSGSKSAKTDEVKTEDKTLEPSSLTTPKTGGESKPFMTLAERKAYFTEEAEKKIKEENDKKKEDEKDREEELAQLKKVLEERKREQEEKKKKEEQEKIRAHEKEEAAKRRKRRKYCKPLWKLLEAETWEQQLKLMVDRMLTTERRSRAIELLKTFAPDMGCSVKRILKEISLWEEENEKKRLATTSNSYLPLATLFDGKRMKIVREKLGIEKNHDVMKSLPDEVIVEDLLDSMVTFISAHVDENTLLSQFRMNQDPVPIRVVSPSLPQDELLVRESLAAASADEEKMVIEALEHTNCNTLEVVGPLLSASLSFPSSMREIEKRAEERDEDEAERIVMENGEEEDDDGLDEEEEEEWDGEEEELRDYDSRASSAASSLPVDDMDVIREELMSRLGSMWEEDRGSLEDVLLDEALETGESPIELLLDYIYEERSESVEALFEAEEEVKEEDRLTPEPMRSLPPFDFLFHPDSSKKIKEEEEEEGEEVKVEEEEELSAESSLLREIVEEAREEIRRKIREGRIKIDNKKMLDAYLREYIWKDENASEKLKEYLEGERRKKEKERRAKIDAGIVAPRVFNLSASSQLKNWMEDLFYLAPDSKDGQRIAQLRAEGRLSSRLVLRKDNEGIKRIFPELLLQSRINKKKKKSVVQRFPPLPAHEWDAIERLIRLAKKEREERGEISAGKNGKITVLLPFENEKNNGMIVLSKDVLEEEQECLIDNDEFDNLEIRHSARIAERTTVENDTEFASAILKEKWEEEVERGTALAALLEDRSESEESEDSEDSEYSEEESEESEEEDVRDEREVIRRRAMIQSIMIIKEERKERLALMTTKTRRILEKRARAAVREQREALRDQIKKRIEREYRLYRLHPALKMKRAMKRLKKRVIEHYENERKEEEEKARKKEEEKKKEEEEKERAKRDGDEPVKLTLLERKKAEMVKRLTSNKSDRLNRLPYHVALYMHCLKTGATQMPQNFKPWTSFIDDDEEEPDYYGTRTEKDETPKPAKTNYPKDWLHPGPNSVPMLENPPQNPLIHGRLRFEDLSRPLNSREEEMVREMRERREEGECGLSTHGLDRGESGVKRVENGEETEKKRRRMEELKMKIEEIRKEHNLPPVSLDSVVSAAKAYNLTLIGDDCPTESIDWRVVLFHSYPSTAKRAVIRAMKKREERMREHKRQFAKYQRAKEEGRMRKRWIKKWKVIRRKGKKRRINGLRWYNKKRMAYLSAHRVILRRERSKKEKPLTKLCYVVQGRKTRRLKRAEKRVEKAFAALDKYNSSLDGGCIRINEKVMSHFIDRQTASDKKREKMDFDLISRQHALAISRGAQWVEESIEEKMDRDREMDRMIREKKEGEMRMRGIEEMVRREKREREEEEEVEDEEEMENEESGSEESEEEEEKEETHVEGNVEDGVQTNGVNDPTVAPPYVSEELERELDEAIENERRLLADYVRLLQACDMKAYKKLVEDWTYDIDEYDDEDSLEEKRWARIRESILAKPSLTHLEPDPFVDEYDAMLDMPDQSHFCEIMGSQAPYFKGEANGDRPGCYINDQGFPVKPIKPKGFQPLEEEPDWLDLSEVEEMYDPDLDERHERNLQKRIKMAEKKNAQFEQHQRVIADRAQTRRTKLMEQFNIQMEDMPTAGSGLKPVPSNDSFHDPVMVNESYWSHARQNEKELDVLLKKKLDDSREMFACVIQPMYKTILILKETLRRLEGEVHGHKNEFGESESERSDSEESEDEDEAPPRKRKRLTRGRIDEEEDNEDDEEEDAKSEESESDDDVQIVQRRTRKPTLFNRVIKPEPMSPDFDASKVKEEPIDHDEIQVIETPKKRPAPRKPRAPRRKSSESSSRSDTESPIFEAPPTSLRRGAGKRPFASDRVTYYDEDEQVRIAIEESLKDQPSTSSGIYHSP